MSTVPTNILVIGTNASGNGGVDISHLATYVVSYPKLWSSDSGRNMRGDNKATLIGIFTKLQVELAPQAYDSTQISSILDVLNNASTYVKYYDIQTRTMKVESMYFSDIETKWVNQDKREIGGFSVIGNHRRS